MMNGQAPLRIFFSDCETVIRQVTQNLETAGLRVVRSFDLRAACASFGDNICPHHGTAPCDCQLVVLLIYGVGTMPVSLILHSHRGQTEMQWDETPEGRPPPELREFIRMAIDGNAGRFKLTEMSMEMSNESLLLPR
jgi:hypothetical protein